MSKNLKKKSRCKRGITSKFPNKKTQFKKGKSGNPDGRPKGRKNTKTIIREYLAALDDGGEWANPLIKAMVEIIFTKDEDGNYKNNVGQRRQAINDLVDRVEGKPEQTMNTPDITKVQFIDPQEKEL